MLIFLIILFLTAGCLGSIFVSSSISSWYNLLKEPFFAPPAFVFAPVWTILYILLAFYFWRLDNLYKKAQNKTLISKLKGLFILQITLNFMWTPAFFGLKNILAGLIILICIDFLVIRMTWLSFKTDKICFYISLIYLGWLFYATCLNTALFILN